MTASPNTLLSAEQVGARLSVSACTVWRYARTNPAFPKPIKLSAGCTRFRSSDIDAFLAAMTD